jgi:DivIVA domain-containing protein
MAVERFPTARADVSDISADLISGRRFAQTWRGYDPEEVKEFLAQVAEQVRTLRERVDIEVAARREADQRAMHPRIDEATLMSAVGEETAAILRSARTAAAEIIAKAEANAQSLVGAAEAKSAELLAHSEALSTRRAEESEVAANDVWAKALADAEELRRSAQQEAAAIVEVASQKGQESIEAAEAVREKILTDLARRRKLATVQIEQLRAGRERLLDAYLVVRHTLDEVTDELHRADAEARAAAVAVGRMDRDEHTGELVDLRRDDQWDSLAAFGGGEAVAHTGDQKTTAETPVVLAPKVTQVASTPAVPSAPVAAAPPVSPSAPSTAVAPSAPVITSAPLAPSAPAVATAPPPRPHSESLPAGENTAIVSRADAVESVRIVRDEPNGADMATTDAPQAAVGASTAEVTTNVTAEEPAVDAPGTEQPGAEANQGKDVQGLFARLRENRDQATRAARKTLRDTGEQEPSAPEGLDTPNLAPGSPGAEGLEATSGPAEGAQNGADHSGTGQSGTDDTHPDITVEEAATVTAEATFEPAGNGAVAAVALEEPLAGAGEAEVDAGAALLQRGDEVTRDLGSSLARKLKRALQDEQNSLLDRLRSLKGTATPANVLPDTDEHPDHFADAGRPLLQQAAQAGAKLAGEMCGTAAPDAVVAQHVDDLAEELGRSIAEPLRQRLELAMRSAGDDPAELADALGAAYREWKTQRIEPSALHEVAAAFARGAYLTFPDDALLRWVVGPAEGACPDCEDNTLAGEQLKGEVWPTGQLCPPAHPGCRCALAPTSVHGTGAAATPPAS